MSRTRRPGPGQLGLFTPAPARPAGLPLCLYDSPARGLQARAAEFEAWKAQHGSSGSQLRAHAWTLGIGGGPGKSTARCQAATLSVDLRQPLRGEDHGLECRCTDADVYLYRGACRGCAWEGEPQPGLGSENLAAEDALDHAWPGWRDLPVIHRKPGSPKAAAGWLERVTAEYPAGWLEAGGPIRTWRTGLGTRHVPGYGPFGGYDAGVVFFEPPCPCQPNPHRVCAGHRDMIRAFEAQYPGGLWECDTCGATARLDRIERIR